MKLYAVSEEFQGQTFCTIDASGGRAEQLNALLCLAVELHGAVIGSRRDKILLPVPATHPDVVATMRRVNAEE